MIHHIYKYRLINYWPNIETFMLTAIYLWNSRSAFIDLSSAAPAHLDAAGGGLLLLKLVCYPPIYAEDVGEDEQVQHCDVTLVASNCCDGWRQQSQTCRCPCAWTSEPFLPLDVGTTKWEVRDGLSYLYLPWVFIRVDIWIYTLTSNWSYQDFHLHCKSILVSDIGYWTP